MAIVLRLNDAYSTQSTIADSKTYFLEKRRRLENIIISNVAPFFSDRIPQVHRTYDIKSLLMKLKSRANPFRLNDLPPEIRATIYGFVFTSKRT